jgi:hypothetical protein
MMMWFAKWFGGDKEADDNDEPARFTAPEIHRLPASASTTITRQKKAAGSVKGFDPYNSGSFEKRNAWERVSRR